MHGNEHSWVVNIFKTPQRQYSGRDCPFDHHTDRGPIDLGQYDGPGPYRPASTSTNKSPT